MRVIVQRVESANVKVDNTIVGDIGHGILAYICIESKDSEKEYKWIANKLFKLRIFNDAQENMNLSVHDVGGEILLVSNFSLLADARNGNRPSFSSGISVEDARKKYDDFMCLINTMSSKLDPPIKIETGIFGAYMKIEAISDGPINIVLDV